MKSRFSVGDRVRAVVISGYESLGVRAGAIGTVRFDVNGSIGRIVDVVWDSGPTLMVLPSYGDVVELQVEGSQPPP